MYRVFEQLLQKKGVTAYQVSKATGISTGSLSDWKNQRSSPKTDKLQKLADYFGVTVDYLLTGEEKEAPAGQSDLKMSEFDYALRDEAAKLTDANKQKLLEMALFFQQQQSKEE